MCLAEQKHSTYDSTHDSFGFLTRALKSLHTHYPHLASSDVLLFHEGDFEPSDLTRLPLPSSVNTRLCLLDCCTGWGPPPAVTQIPYYLENVRPLEHWNPGYLYMARFYSVTRLEGVPWAFSCCCVPLRSRPNCTVLSYLPRPSV